MRPRFVLLAIALTWAVALTPAIADNLYSERNSSGLASDRRASEVGDILTVIVYQNAEARNAAQNLSRKRHSFGGAISTGSGSTEESAEFSLDGSYTGQGEVRRSESFITQISVVVQSVLANGDFIVAGEQRMNINGEETNVRVRGRIRPTDISAANQVLSTRIADAEISYDGRGFVSRNARPGFIQRAFSLLGLGG